MIKNYDETTGGIEFLGLKMQQNFHTPIVWSEAARVLKPERIIEIGTGSGGFTQLLASLSPVVTFDPKNKSNPWPDHPSITYLWDCFSEGLVEKLIQEGGPCFVLCDGWDKPREFNTFAPFLKIGDVIAAHDYLPGGTKVFWSWSEITLRDVAATVMTCGLEPFMQDDMDRAAWLCFRRVK